MKKIITMLALSITFIATAWSQNQDNKDILICASDKSNFTLSELEKYCEITLKNSDVRVAQPFNHPTFS